MILGYAQSGRAIEALHLFDHRVDVGYLPDHICFTAVFTAYNHRGFLDRAMDYFEKMRRGYGLAPTLDHYACLIDLHAQKGHLTQAVELMEKMPFDPNNVILTSILSCCKTHGSVELGREIANRVFEVQPHNMAAYLTMTHIYRDAGLEDGVANMRKTMKQKVTKKSAAWSWIEVVERIDVFLVGDVWHQMSDHIYVILEHLNIDIRDSRSLWEKCGFEEMAVC